MIRNAAIAFAALLAATSAASAASADDGPHSYCFGLHSGDMQMMRSAKVISDSAPLLSQVKFKAGARVVITKMEGGFDCVEGGWIAASQVRMLPVAQSRPHTKWLLGWWKTPGGKILFQMKDGKLWASGASTWQGRSDPHFGQFGGHPYPYGSALKVNDDDTQDQSDPDLIANGCQLQMVALGNKMVVQDNGKCGGTNVSFTGTYTRWHPRVEKH